MIHRSTDPNCKNCTSQGGFCICPADRCHCPGPKGNGAPEWSRWSGGICHTCNGWGYRPSGRSVTVRKVRLNNGGYEYGKYGQYWGTGAPLYRAQETVDGETEEIRAYSREEAIKAFAIPAERLIRP